jgi:hypothetical protein
MGFIHYGLEPGYHQRRLTHGIRGLWVYRHHADPINRRHIRALLHETIDDLRRHRRCYGRAA